MAFSVTAANSPAIFYENALQDPKTGKWTKIVTATAAVSAMGDGICIARCIVSGLKLSASGLVVKRAAGTVNGYQLKKYKGTATVTVPDDATSFIWLKETGTITYSATKTAPDGAYLFLGVATSSSGSVTFDYSGVMYFEGGLLWRQTSDAGAPGDTPPAALRFFNKTAGGVYIWDGAAYNLLAGTIAELTSSAAELNLLDGSVAGTAVASKAAVLGASKNLDILGLPVGGLKIGAGGAEVAVTPTAAELNVLAGQKGAVQMAEVTFTETSGAGTYTGAVTVPAGAAILDIIVNGVALWDNAGTVTMKVGDTDDDGFYTGIDLKATDLLAGESISFALAGGKAGAYIANSQVSPRYSATERTINGIIVTSSTGGSAGRTRMTVIWALPTASTAATKA